MLLLSLIRGLVEVAGLFLLGQGVLHLLAGRRRLENPMYRLFALLTRPPLALFRFLLPRGIPDRHLPIISFFLLLGLWLFLAYLRQDLCLGQGPGCL